MNPPMRAIDEIEVGFRYRKDLGDLLVPSRQPKPRARIAEPMMCFRDSLKFSRSSASTAVDK
jgi:hypothetical protein